MADYAQGSISNFLNLNNIFFSIENHVIHGVDIEVSFDPEEFITIFTEDRAVSSYVKKSMQNAQVIFDLETYYGTHAYNTLWLLSYDQAFIDKAPENEFKKLVYNDGMQFKVVTNHAVFTKIPPRKPNNEGNKVAFQVRSGIFTVTKPLPIRPIIADVSRL